jgi:transcriptional regulator with XRE-family HTH domain
MLDADKLRTLREAKNLSQGQLSKQAGLGRNAVSRLESQARGKRIQHSTIVALATALDVEPGALEGDGPPRPVPDPPAPLEPVEKRWDWRTGV